MAGPVPTYLSTQTTAQTNFTVPFGLLSFVNNAIAAATAAGEFNVTVDCSLFVTEDVSNLRIYLDSLGYRVEYAKNTNDKSLNIDWGRFLDIPGTEVVVDQGTSPWIVAGTVTANQGTSPWVVTGTITTSPDVNIHDSAGNALTSTGGALDVNVSFPGSISVTQGTSPWVVSGSVSVSNFPAVQPVSGTVTADQGTSPWTVDGTMNVGNFPASQNVVVTNTPTVNQGTSPWVVSGSVTTSPDVNVHDASGNPITSTGTSLDVNVTDFPATVAVTQSTSPWAVAGTVTANQGTSPWSISGTVAATQSGAWTTGRTWALSSGTDSVATVQSGTWTVQQGTPPWSVSVTNFPATQPVSGTVTALQGTSPWVVSGTVTANAGTGTFNNQQSNVTIDYDTGAGTQNLTVWGIALPASGGAVAGGTATNPVRIDPTGTTPQPASQSGTWTTGRTWALSSGTDSVAAAQSGSWTVAGTGNFTVVQPTGTNLHTVLDSGTLTSITNALPAGTNVIGHVITDTGSTTTVTGNVTVVQPTGTNLHAVVDSGSITVNNGAGASAVNIQDGGNSITVDGTVTANQGTPNSVGNSWPIKVTDATDTMGVNTDGSIVSQPLLDWQIGQAAVFTVSGSFNAATNGTDNPIILLKNPNASGKTMRLRKLMVGCTVANVIMEIKIFYAPTITANGTAQTPRNNLIGSGTASVASAFSLPTLSSNGTQIFDYSFGQNTAPAEINLLLDVQANQNVVITASPASNNRAVQITAIWAEN